MNKKKLFVIIPLAVVPVGLIGVVLAGFISGFFESFAAMPSKEQCFEEWSAEQEYTSDYAVKAAILKKVWKVVQH